MDGIIEVKVNGYSITKDNNCAGTQYENKSTKLRITFSENWNDYDNKITFWNALGKNPVDIHLGTNLLEDILKSGNVYLVPIPGEAMTEAGEFEFVIDGVDTDTGVVKRTVGDKLKVLRSPMTNNASNHVDPTPSDVQQIRDELESIKIYARDAKEAEGNAQVCSEEAHASAAMALDSYVGAQECAASASREVKSVKDMTVSSETLEEGAEATVAKTMVGGVYNLHFGIPTGNAGVYIGDEEPTDPNVNVWVDTSGEADVLPHIALRDAETGKVYIVFVSDGKLMMKESEG